MRKPRFPGLWEKKRFKEKANSIIIVPVHFRGWVAIAGFIALLSMVAYANFGYEDTPLKAVFSFIIDMVLLVGVCGWLFDKKSEKKG